MSVAYADHKTSEQLRAERRKTAQPCGLIEVAPLWPKTGENLGTLLRTCDAVGACMVVPHTANAVKALKAGNTIGLKNSPVHYIGDPIGWLGDLPHVGRVLGVELVRGATLIGDLEPARQPTVVVLGHETNGIPREAYPYIDEMVEIPMKGVGNSLNVAVAGSLVLYRLKGWM